MSICLFVGLITCASSVQAQSTKEFKKDAVRNFVFKALTGQVGNKTKFRLNQKDNIVELKGDSAFVNVSKSFNKDMGKHGIGGVLHKGTISRLEGIGYDGIAKEVLVRHKLAHTNIQQLDTGGYYQWKRKGESHLFNPETIHLLQKSSFLSSWVLDSNA